MSDSRPSDAPSPDPDGQVEPTGPAGADEAGAGDAELSFGPGGYLPERAARRARKIVLRAPLGLQWVIGALVVGVVVVVAGVLALRSDVPSAPFQPLPAEALPASTGGDPVVVEVDGRDVLVLGVLGRTRAFDWSDPDTAVPSYCRESGLLEASDGSAWRATGRGVDGTPSLVELPTQRLGDQVYVDPTSPLPPLDPDDQAALEVACAAAG